MYNRLLVLGFAPDTPETARADAVETLRAAAVGAGARSLLLAPTLPGVFLGGDVLLRIGFADRAAADAGFASAAWAPAEALLAAGVFAQVEDVRYRTEDAGGSEAASGLYRVALFSAMRDPSPERLAAFRADTLAMPPVVRSIVRWQLSTVDSATGTRPWTHVWEQEYPDLAGLNGPYMMHPVHWARIERWFDTEYPECLVDPVLVHSFCDVDQPVLGCRPA